MKKLILSLVLMAAMIGAMAQTSPIATLSHNGNVRVFYSNTALQQALDASQQGDTICLSDGDFLGGTIQHHVTILGVGCFAGDMSATWITSDMNINIPDTENTGRLYLEGMRFRNYVYQNSALHEAYVTRCRFNVWYVRSASAVFNGMFVHCRFYEFLSSYSADYHLQFVNCVVNYNFIPSLSAEAYNCILRYEEGYNIYNTRLRNCILIPRSGYYFPNSSCTAINCMVIGANSSYLDGCHGSNNMWISHTAFDQVFRTYRGDNGSDTETYELTDSIKATFISVFGTEAGIHGGAYPFETINPSYPHISRVLTDHVVNAEGRLQVQIFVTEGE
ncbi:MAG: hypothetical protein MJZ77_00505 [Bacteroidales bacterium]|nr:hypothetical protein [Bacteroidales bacterium]